MACYFNSLVTPSGSGFEAFFTHEGRLIIAVGLKKEYNAIKVEGPVIADQQWV